MILARTRRELARALDERRSDGSVLALVPTMGYLHEGHLSLIDAARAEAERVAMTVFVNPLQFGPDEDYEEYPRDPERDRELARARGVDLLFVPRDGEMYPQGPPVVTVDPGAPGRRLCGAHRPGHFRGVLTVVARLFGLFRPEVAVFGRKDYQQGVLIDRMARDLDLGVRVVLAPVVREEDGLAMSSRNAYLSTGERREAVRLHRGLRRALERFRDGESDVEALRRVVREEVEASSLLRLQYADLVDPGTLEPVERVRPGTVAAVAAFAGSTRLIDNLVIE